MSENNKITEYGVYEKIKEKVPEPIVLFKDKNEAKDTLNIIKSCAKKHKIPIYYSIYKKDVNGENFYALNVKIGRVLFSELSGETYYKSKEEAEEEFKEFNKDMKNLSYFFETESKIVSRSYYVK